jgi:TPR repeat protein
MFDIRHVASLAAGVMDANSPYAEPMDPADPNAPWRLWEQAAETGDSGAIIKIGMVYAQRTDLNAAWQWWERAEQAGNSDAWFYLGIVYAEWIDPPDLDMARFWSRRAALKGSVQAARKLKELG